MRHLFIIIGLLINTVTCVSQIIDFKNDEYWVDAGLGGFNTFNKIYGATVYSSVNLFNDITFYKIRYLKSGEDLFSFSILLPEQSPTEEYNSISLMIGKGFSRKYLQLQFLGGLGITGGIKRGKFVKRVQYYLVTTEYYEEDKFVKPSIPLEIDLLIKPIEYFGIGVTLFGDLNFVRPYCGLALKLSVGKLR